METSSKIDSLSNATEFERLFLQKAIDLQKPVLNSLNLRMKFESTKFYQNDGLSSLEIYEKVISGFSNLTKYEDFCLNYALEMYLGKNTSTIAFTSMEKAKIFVNRLAMNHWMSKPNGVAWCSGSLFHEYLHSMGFTHKYFPIGTKRKSVPYLGGAIMRDLILFHLGGGVLTPLRK